MRPSRFLLAMFALLAFGANSALAFSQPGRLLERYPEADIEDYAKIHPDRADASLSQSTLISQKLGLEAASQAVADQIIAREQSRACNTTDARYFQIKAVYELRDTELSQADRDLRRAQDALAFGCQPPVLMAELEPAPAPMPNLRDPVVKPGC